MTNRPVRDTASPWGLIHSFVHLNHVVTHGSNALREHAAKRETTEQERVVGYFIVHGLVEALGHVREALRLLVEVAPCLSGIDEPFSDDLNLWTRFRDDAAHMIDRTHRVSNPGQNDATIGATEYGYDTDTLGYDRESDEIRTGATDRLPLAAAVQRTYEILVTVDEKISEAGKAGLIPPPPRFRSKPS